MASLKALRELRVLGEADSEPDEETNPKLSALSPPPSAIAGAALRYVKDIPMRWLCENHERVECDGLLLLAAADLRWLTQHDPSDSAFARSAWVAALAETRFSDCAAQIFDEAVPRPVSWRELIAAGLPWGAARSNGQASSEGLARAQIIEIAWTTPGVLLPLKHGRPSGTYGACISLLRAIPHLLDGKPLTFNEMCADVQLGSDSLTEVALLDLANRIESFTAIEFQKEKLQDAVKLLADERRINPVRAYLEGLPVWDGVPRIAWFVTSVLKPVVRDGEDASVVQVYRMEFRKFMISGVARAMNPGCKVDTVLILQGPQGAKKSSTFRELTPEGLFGDMSVDISDRDGLMTLHKRWINELAEMESILHARSHSAAKAFLSRQADTYREPWGKRPYEHPRHFVVVATINEEEALHDPTGSRRYWIIPVSNEIDHEQIAGVRDLLWAEALAAWRSGERWWNSSDEEKLVEKTRKHFKPEDPWTHDLMQKAWELWREIQNGLAKDKHLRISTLLKAATRLELAQIDRRTEMRAATILSRAGWIKFKDGDGCSVWKPPSGSERDNVEVGA